MSMKSLGIRVSKVTLLCGSCSCSRFSMNCVGVLYTIYKLAMSVPPSLCPFSLSSWDLAWLLWPLLTLSNTACRDPRCSLGEVPGMGEKWRPHDSVRAQSTSSWLCGSRGDFPWITPHRRGWCFAMVWRLRCDPRHLRAPGTFRMTGNEAGLGASSDLGVSLQLQGCLTHRAPRLSAAPARKCFISLTGHSHPSWSTYQRGEIPGSRFLFHVLKGQSSDRRRAQGLPPTERAERRLRNSMV